MTALAHQTSTTGGRKTPLSCKRMTLHCVSNVQVHVIADDALRVSHPRTIVSPMNVQVYMSMLMMLV